MAYLHCHSCDWSQDDFWDWNWKGLKRFWKFRSRPFGYNPVSLFLEDFAEYIRPRSIGMDWHWMEENGFKGDSVFSWRMMLFEWVRHIKRIFTQKWWTNEAFDKEKNKVCPECKEDNLDID